MTIDTTTDTGARGYKVYGGELRHPGETDFRDPSEVHAFGEFSTYDAAFNAWQAEAWRTVDNAHMRYFIEPV